MIQDFPILGWWSEQVVHPSDQAKFRTAAFHEYYRVKYALASLWQPAAIAEIGVRWGYSAWSFLRAVPVASYTGYDLQRGTHGGVKGTDTFADVRRLLSRDFPAASIELRHADTQQLTTLGGPFDLLHVDGDHSEAGCSHDLELALAACRPDGIILVDDYDYIDGVTRAVDAFIKSHHAELSGWLRVPSLRGEFVIRR